MALESFIPIREPDDPTALRWMLFVDGENFTIRAQAVAKARGYALKEGPYWRPDIFVWIPDWPATQGFRFSDISAIGVRRYATRAYFYTSARGDPPTLREIRDDLWTLGFTPYVFQRTGDRKSKGVDIALTKDVLSHAFLSNYDAAVLIAGDGDYVPLIEEVKRLGKLVFVLFFREPDAGLSDELRLAADNFIDLSDVFFEKWTTLEGAGGPLL